MRELLDFISKDVKQFMRENGLSFSDFATAGILYNSHLPVEEIHRRLQMLAERTEDGTLKQQIAERLAVKKEEMDAFFGSTEGYLYELQYTEEREQVAHFSTAAFAHAFGCTLGAAFKIEKYPLFRTSDAKRTRKSYLNPYMGSNEDEIESVLEYDGFDAAVAMFSYNAAGELTYFWSDEIERSDERNLELIYSPHRFENAFPFLPNPFERGDIVKDLRDGLRGIVETSQEGWGDFLRRVRNGLYSDFFDASITVEYLNENGHFYHGHTSPVFLERFAPERGEDEYEILTAAQSVLREGGSLDWFLTAYEAYRKKCREG